jgi:hypothetical protein
MRKLVFVVAAAVLGVAQAAPSDNRVVNLDRPGVLDTVQRDNPEHYRKITEILRIAQAEPCETLPQVLKVRFNALGTDCRAYQLLTSDPPKRHLAFTLDGTNYVTNAVQTNLGGKVISAK